MATKSNLIHSNSKNIQKISPQLLQTDINLIKSKIDSLNYTNPKIQNEIVIKVKI